MLTMPEEEIREITGYAQPSKQLAELKRQGFHRARRSPVTGRIVLERAHYDAVCCRESSSVREPELRA